MKKVAVECRHIGLSYGRTEVLKDVSLKIEPGEFFALLGPSGSGKSTLLRLIAGFNRHNRGELLVDGRDITGVAPHARNIGMVFQSYALWPHLTVFDNVAFGLVERKLPREEIRRRTDAALDLVGLKEFAARRPNQLSGGQQQRVALARTIVIEPQVLLLDEPLSNLDKKLRVTMRQELLALQRKLGITTIFVTHDQEEAMTTADRMAVLDAGIMQQVGTPAELYDAPANRFVAEFVGTMNLLEGSVSADGDALRFDVGGVGAVRLPRLPDAPGSGKLALSFRPHAVRMAVGPAAAEASGRSQLTLSGVVQGSEFLGEFTRYLVAVGTHPVTTDQPHLAGTRRIEDGAAVTLAVAADQLRVLR
jgi:iron(III) transport system ATP-binding protein